MRAVNLIPADSRGRGSRSPSTGMQVPVYVLLGFLAAAVALVTVYVLTNNTIASRTAKLNNLKTLFPKIPKTLNLRTMAQWKSMLSFIKKLNWEKIRKGLMAYVPIPPVQSYFMSSFLISVAVGRFTSVM